MGILSLLVYKLFVLRLLLLKVLLLFNVLFSSFNFDILFLNLIIVLCINSLVGLFPK